MRVIVVWLAVVGTCGFCFGGTFRVELDGSGDYSTIQAAVDAAADGDTILVGDGVYSGEGNCGVTVDKSLTIKSAGGREVCIIEGTSAFHEACVIVSAPGKQVAIEGLTVRNGRRGFVCGQGRCTISNCTIEYNQDDGGIFCGRLCELIVSNCVIRNNLNGHGGGGIHSHSRHLEVRDCVIEGNRGLSGGINAVGSTTISGCVIRNNIAEVSVGGILCAGLCRIDNSLIVDNELDGVSGHKWGGIRCISESASSGMLILTNSVVANNTADTGPASGISLGVDAYIRNSIVYRNQASQDSLIELYNARLIADHCIMPTEGPGMYASQMASLYLGEGVEDIDPGFVDADNGDYRLRADSVCIDAGSNDFRGESLTDDVAGQERVLDGDEDGEAVCDIGAYELLPGGEKVIRASAGRVHFTQIGGVLDSGVQSVRIRCEGGDLGFEISEDCPWLSVDTVSGVADAEGVEVNLTVDTTGLAPETYTCEVTVSAGESLNGSETITVVLYVVEEDGFWVPFHYETIQAGLDACPEGGTVVVAEGSYMAGNKGIVFPDRPIVLKSATGAEHCRILGGQVNSYYARDGAIIFDEVGDGARFEGLTITGCLETGGIAITRCSPTISDCVISFNLVGQYGSAISCSESGSLIEGCSVGYNMGQLNRGIYLVESNVSIEDCTINNNATSGYSSDPGAGIFTKSGGVTRVSDCTIRDNLCAGIRGHGGGTVKVARCLISGNLGSGVYTGYMRTYLNACRLEVSDCVITGNSALEGGAVYSGEEGVTEIRNCTISKNFSSQNLGGTGGGVYAENGRTVIISDSVISENTVGGNGGGIRCNEGCTLLMDNCTISDNGGGTGEGIPGNGGGIYGYKCAAVRISNSVVRGNMCRGSGGGVNFALFINSEPGYEENYVMENCVISGNTSQDWGGGGVYGAGVLVNCTIVGNRSLKAGSGALLIGRIVNCIARDNVCEEDPYAELYTRQYAAAHLRIDYSNFAGGVAGETAYDDYTSGANNMDVDPLFAEDGRWDDDGTPDDMTDDVWVDGDYHLKSVAGRWDAVAEVWVHDDVTSECVDAGDPASVWWGELWPHGRRVNLGAYGGKPAASMSAFPVGFASDLNHDDHVDIKDFALIGCGWRGEGLLLARDLNRDGIVDLRDIALFGDDWLKSRN